MRATLDYYAGNYSPALQRLAHALPEIQRSSPVAVAATLTFRGRVELAAGSAQAAEQTLAEAERLYVANDRAGHVQRWVAHGLHGVALAATGNRLIGDAQPGAKKVGYTVMPTYKADAPLRPSGLIGPVRLMSAGQ